MSLFANDGDGYVEIIVVDGYPFCCTRHFLGYLMTKEYPTYKAMVN
jgi:hypothetical protein